MISHYLFSVVFEFLEDLGKSKCHISMPIFDHYTNENDVGSLFFQVRFDLNTIIAPPPKSFNLSSSLTHYSLYPYMLDMFIIPIVPINHLDLYLVDFGCNHVKVGVILQL